MKRFPTLTLCLLLLTGCAEQVKDTSSQNQVFGNTTDNTKLSSEKIDGYVTYEVTFTIEKPVDCITINIESVNLIKTFPVQKIPEKTYFIVEKRLKLPQFKLKNSDTFSPIGRNFNNDWDIYSPVKICSNKSDPLSVLDKSEYRIRFTTFEKTTSYYNLTITSESKIIFAEPVHGKGR